MTEARARKVVENYKPVIHIDPDWELVKLGEVCEFNRLSFGGYLKKETFVTSGHKVYEKMDAIFNDSTEGRY